MLTVRYNANQTVNGEKNLFGIGTCRIRDLLTPPSKHKDRLMISGFTHSLGDTIQKFRYLNGDLHVPKYLFPLIFGSGEKSSLKAGGKITTLCETLYGGETSAIVVEWSSNKRFQIEGFDINPFYLGGRVVRKGGLEFLEWWKDITNKKEIDEGRISNMVENRGNIDLEMFDDDALFAILRGLETSIYDASMVESSLKTIDSLTEGIKKIYVVPYGSQGIDDMIMQNTSISEGFNFLDMNGIVSSIGPDNAFLGKSTDHFEPDMVESLSAKFYDEMAIFLG